MANGRWRTAIGYWLLAICYPLLAACTPTTPAPRANDFITYTFDASDIIQSDSGRAERGTLIVSHNAVAFFPFDLRAANRKLEKTGNTTVIEAQTKSICAGAGRVALSDEHDIVRNLNAPAIGGVKFRDAATIRRVTIEMPDTVPQDAYAFTRVAQTFCFGFHSRGGAWTWDFSPRQPTRDDARKIATAEIALNEMNVDALGFLFDAAVAISRLTIEAKKE